MNIYMGITSGRQMGGFMYQVPGVNKFMGLTEFAADGRTAAELSMITGLVRQALLALLSARGVGHVWDRG